jgi:hypothetical protein
LFRHYDLDQDRLLSHEELSRFCTDHKQEFPTTIFEANRVDCALTPEERGKKFGINFTVFKAFLSDIDFKFYHSIAKVVYCEECISDEEEKKHYHMPQFVIREGFKILQDWEGNYVKFTWLNERLTQVNNRYGNVCRYIEFEAEHNGYRCVPSLVDTLAEVQDVLEQVSEVYE